MAKKTIGKKAAAKKAAPEAIIAALRDQLPSLQMQRRTDGDFRPHPATWLNQGRWADESDTLTDTHPYAHLPAPKNWDALRAEAEASRGGAS